MSLSERRGRCLPHCCGGCAAGGRGAWCLPLHAKAPPPSHPGPTAPARTPPLVPLHMVQEVHERPDRPLPHPCRTHPTTPYPYPTLHPTLRLSTAQVSAHERRGAPGGCGRVPLPGAAGRLGGRAVGGAAAVPAGRVHAPARNARAAGGVGRGGAGWACCRAGGGAGAGDVLTPSSSQS